MADRLVSELAHLCANRFVSVGDAVRSLLTFLQEELPPGRVIFGELNYNTDEYRVLDALGVGVEALSAGARLPLRDSFCIHMANDAAPALTGKASRDAVYKTLDLRKTARIESYVAAPLELSDGTRVASVVGCKGVEGAVAFRSRLEASFERVMSQRPEEVHLIAGIEKLGDADSPAEALQRAEESLGPEPVAAAG